jgi:hypothetical protein
MSCGTKRSRGYPRGSVVVNRRFTKLDYHAFRIHLGERHTMDRDDDVVGKLQQALAAAEQSAKSEIARDHEILVEVLAELRSAATRACHAHVDCASLIANLHAGKALSTAEMSTLRLMIVGDADSYLKYDEEFQRCKTELRRLFGELEEFRAKALDIDILMRLNVLCQEAGAILTMAGH